MDEKRYCACGCGGEVTTWKNGRTGPFLRGHHMRKKEGYKSPALSHRYCKCGCGTEILPLPNGHMRKYVFNHHRNGISYTIEQRIKRMQNRWNREPVFSPYVPDTFISFCEGMKRWKACIRKNNKATSVLHSSLVYKHHFGEIYEGYVVHHKDGKHEKITDDRPENLMLLPDEWNLRFFPVLAKGFGVPEAVVTESYLSIFDKSIDKEDLFAELCDALIKRRDSINV